MFKSKLSRQGFSLVELLLVMAIAASIAAFSIPYGLKFYRDKLLDDASSTLVDTLQRARHNAILQKNDRDFGIKISTSTNSYTLFQGADYDDRETDYDEIYEYLPGVTVSGLTEVTFNKLTGVPSATGTISLSFSTFSSEITINTLGTIYQSN